MSQQINLYNPLFRKQGISFTSATAMLYAVGSVIGGMALLTAYLDYEVRAAAKQAQAVELSLRDLTMRRDKLVAAQAARKPNTQLEAEIALLETQLRGREEVTDALKSGAVGTTSGFSEYLRAFSRQSVNGLWLTGFDIAGGGNELSISGRALNADLVPAYLKRLNQEKSLQGRQFAAMRINQPTAGRAPAKSADKEAKDAKAQQPVLPRYLEFTISTGDLGTAGATAPSAAQAPQPLPLQVLNLSAPAGAGEAAKADSAPGAAK